MSEEDIKRLAKDASNRRSGAKQTIAVKILSNE